MHHVLCFCLPCLTFPRPLSIETPLKAISEQWAAAMSGTYRCACLTNSTDASATHDTPCTPLGCRNMHAKHLLLLKSKNCTPKISCSSWKGSIRFHMILFIGSEVALHETLSTATHHGMSGLVPSSPLIVSSKTRHSRSNDHYSAAFTAELFDFVYSSLFGCCPDSSATMTASFLHTNGATSLTHRTFCSQRSLLPLRPS